MGDPGLPGRTRLGPPGVDVHAFAPQRRPRGRASRRLAARLHAAERRGRAVGSGVRPRRPRGRRRARPARPGDDRLVVYVGKLIVSKGVDLLAAAWPLVLAARARRAARRRRASAPTARGSSGCSPRSPPATSTPPRALAEEGAGAEGGPRAPLQAPAGFLDDRSTTPYLEAARAAARARRRRRAPRARRARRPAARLRGPGRLEHVPRGVRHGRRRGGRRAACSRSAPRTPGWPRSARCSPRRCPAEARPWLSFPRRARQRPRAGRPDRRVAAGADAAIRERDARRRWWTSRASGSRGRASPTGSSRRPRDGSTTCATTRPAL